MKRLLVVSAVAVGGLLLADPAHADDPTLSVVGLHQDASTVAFYLSARDLPAGLSFDTAKVSVSADGVQLATKTAPVAGGGSAAAPKRVTVLVLDTSGSMAGAPIAGARAAAAAYVQALPADVQVGLVTVSTTDKVLLSPTRDRSAIAAAIGGIAAAGNTVLYDGIRDAAGLLGAPADGDQRRLVVLSDGADTGSHTTLAQLDTVLAQSRVAVDTVGFRTTGASAAVLADLANHHGGHAYTAADAAALATAFRAAAGSFSSQLEVTATVPSQLAGKDSTLQISVLVGDATVATSVPVSFDIDPNAPVALAGVRSAPLAVWYVVIAAVVFLGLLTLGLVVFAPLIDYARHRRRVAQVEQFRLRATAPSAADVDRSLAEAALTVSAKVVRAGGMDGRIALRLDRAGMRLRPHEWLLVQVSACVGAAVLLSLVVDVLLGVVLGVLLGWVATTLYLRNKADRRVQAFARQLPDALQLIIGSLRSGFSLSQAVDAMTRESPEPIASEFARALAETRLGVELEDALTRLAERVHSKDLAWAVVAIRVQREVGGNLAEVLSTTVGTMRERESLRRHVRALSAEGRLSAWILIGLPVGMAAYMLIVRPSYMRPLYTQPVGIVMLVAGVLLVLVGGFWMSRIVKVEV